MSNFGRFGSHQMVVSEALPNLGLPAGSKLTDVIQALDVASGGSGGGSGSAIHTGDGAPTSGLGNVTDLYIDNLASDLYQKTSSEVWTLQGNLKGADGADGAQGPAGADGADGADGAQGPAGADGTPADLSDYVRHDGSVQLTGDMSFVGNGTPKYYGFGWTAGISGTYVLTLTPEFGDPVQFSFTPTNADFYAQDGVFVTAFNADAAMIAAGFRSYNADTQAVEALKGLASNHFVIVGPPGINFTISKTGNGGLVDISAGLNLPATVTPLRTIKNVAIPTNANEVATKSYVDALGGANFLAPSDSHAEDGVGNWVVFNDASALVDGIGGGTTSTTSTDLTLSVTSTAGEVLSAGTKSFKLVKIAGTAKKQGVSVPFVIPLGFRTKKSKIGLKFKIVSGAVADGDISIKVIQDAGVTNKQPDMFLASKILGTQGEAVAYFDPSVAFGNHRLVIETSLAGAVTIVWDAVEVSDNEVIYGEVDSNWSSTINNAAGTLVTDSGTMTNYTLTQRFKKRGDTLFGKVSIAFTGAPGSWTVLNYSLPSGLTIDTTKVTNSVGGQGHVGQGTLTGAAQAPNITLYYLSSTQIRPRYVVTTSGTNPVNTTNQNIDAGTVASGMAINFEFEVPIVGWTSNVQMASSAQFKISDYLASGTRVTATPTALGQYRTYKKAAANQFGTGTDDAPTVAPSLTNGMLIYGNVPYNLAGTAGQTTRWEIFVGKNKSVRFDWYSSTGRTGILDVNRTNNYSSYEWGADVGYDPTTGIAYVDGMQVLTTVTGGRFLGKCLGASGANSDGASGYFDITVSENALMVGAEAYKVPTIQKLLSGSGTYIPPYGVKYIKPKLVGGGGGGGGSGTSGTGGQGGTGGTTTFGSSLLTATGGAGGWNPQNIAAGGAGGTASIGTGAVGTAMTGNRGALLEGNPSSYIGGGQGGVSPFGGGSGGGYSTGSPGGANTGSGGSGGGGNGVSVYAGSGGGSGGYIDAIIVNPQASYPYAVGAAGTAGAAGTSGTTGGAGGSGYIIIEEYFQ